MLEHLTSRSIAFHSRPLLARLCIGRELTDRDVRVLLLVLERSGSRVVPRYLRRGARYPSGRLDMAALGTGSQR